MSGTFINCFIVVFCSLLGVNIPSTRHTEKLKELDMYEEVGQLPKAGETSDRMVRSCDQLTPYLGSLSLYSLSPRQEISFFRSSLQGKERFYILGIGGLVTAYLFYDCWTYRKCEKIVEKKWEEKCIKVQSAKKSPYLFIKICKKITIGFFRENGCDIPDLAEITIQYLAQKEKHLYKRFRFTCAL